VGGVKEVVEAVFLADRGMAIACSVFLVYLQQNVSLAGHYQAM
jgi:hypothetical protein